MQRKQKILLAGYLAVGFVLLRLIYAFLFSGLWGQTTIVSLPSLRLSGPFSHVTLLGDVTLEGLLRNLELAAPFALWILVFGIAAAFVGANQLRKAADKMPWFKNLLNAIAISLSTLPGLFDAAKRVISAMGLRGERKSRSFVPILERSIELANSVGLKLSLTPKRSSSASSFKALDLSLPELAIGPINLEVRGGEIAVITGPTGSGKSSLLEAIAGISSEYRGLNVEGSVSFDGREQLSLSEISAFLRYIPQNPRELLWGWSVDDVLSAVSTKVSLSLGLDRLRGRSTSDLSEGEALKLLLAENLALNPKILLLDEPYAPLDTGSKLELSSLLSALASQGLAIVVVEHDQASVAGLSAKHFQINHGQLSVGSYETKTSLLPREKVAVGSELALQVELPDLGYGELLIQSTSFGVNQAECVWLSGENGSGKTTLLKALASGEGVLVHGQKPKGPGLLALIPENFDDFFVTDSLQQELDRADKVAGVASGFTLTSLQSILPMQHLDSWLAVHPRDLSRGTRLALAVAMQLSHKPQVLLIDEPFRGLDPSARDMMVESLACVLETGCAIVFASHEATWSKSLATKKLVINNKTLSEVTQVSA